MALELNQSEEIISNYGIKEFKPLFEINEQLKTNGMSDLLESQFIRFCYHAPIIIVFDWMKWDEGKEAYRAKDFEGKDIHYLCKLITMVVRSDRFTENLVYCEMQNGTLSMIIDEIEKLIDEK